MVTAEGGVDAPLIFVAVVSATVALALLATLLPGWQVTRRTNARG